VVLEAHCAKGIGIPRVEATGEGHWAQIDPEDKIVDVKAGEFVVGGIVLGGNLKRRSKKQPSICR